MNHNDLIRRLCDHNYELTIGDRRKAADALDAERLKRQQAEHERDSILEDLAGTKATLDAARRNERRLRELLLSARDYVDPNETVCLYGAPRTDLLAAIDAALAQGDTREGT